MKTIITTLTVLLLSLVIFESQAIAQDKRDLQYFRAPDKTGINVFESPIETVVV